MSAATTTDVLSVRVPLKLIAELRRIATEEGESRGVIIRRVLKRGLQAEQRETSPRV
jgi:metal-responsive CopG/Arc/MetJ family transcriptional regulator